jgi:hypothetical protein
MPEIIKDYMLENKNKYLAKAKEFEKIFHRRLWNYWSMVYGLNAIEFDKFIAPGDGQSTYEKIREVYGDRAVALIKELIGDTTSTGDATTDENARFSVQ